MREMKDSGIEWIGEIPADWKVVKVANQYTERKVKVSDNDYPPLSVTIKGILPQLATAAKTDAHDDRKLVCKGDFAINSRSDRRGSCGISPYDGSVSLINTILKPRDEMNAEYYDWLFHTTMFSDEFYKWGHGIVNDLWTTNWQDMKKISIPEPALPEQQKIADYLDSECAKIDDVITKTKTTIEKYKKLKQSVITEAVTKGIRPNREMKDSGIEWIGEIPREWNVVKGTRMINSTQNGLTRRDLAESMGHIVLKLKNITSDGKISYDYINRIQLTTNEIDNYSLVDGDFLFVRVNGSKKLVGKCVIYKDNGEITAYNDHIIRVRLNNNCSKEYFYWYLYSSAGKTEIDLHTSTAAGQYTISGEGLRDICIALPRIDEQQEIADYLDQKCSEIDTLIAKKEQIVTELESYKKSLIYEYVTGKREVFDMTEKEETITIFDPQAARRMQMALAYKVIKQSGNDLKGRIHLMKIIYMLDCMLGLGLGINYLRYTRGPYNPIIESIEKNLSDKGIISVNTAKNYSYTVIDDSFDSKYNELFAKHNSEIEKIIDYMKRMKSSRAEKIATLYAAWNDMVIDGVQNITDKMIIDDVMNNWTENKAKTDFSTWQHILNDMKDKKIIPHGYGKHTRPRSE